MTNGRQNGHHVEVLVKTPEQVNEDILGWPSKLGGRYRLAAVAFGALAVLGVVGFVMRLQDGFEDYTAWAYLAAAFGFVMTFSMSAPLVAVVPRLARGHWGRPISRIAELWAVVGLLLLVVMIPLLLAMPETEGRNTFWFVDKYREGWPPEAPHVWLALLMVFLVINGLGLLWTSAIPDFAASRDRGRGGLHRRLALGWHGTKRQWRAHRAALGVLGALYFAFMIFAHTMVSYDFAQSLVPGMRDSIFPAWYALGGLQSALAVVLVTSYLVRALGGFKDYIGMNQFWSISKMLLAVSLLWAYFWWSGFIVLWYGKTETEQNLVQLFWFGPARPLFLANLVLNFLAPLLLLMWNPIRKSVLGPSVVGAVILVGALVDRIRIFVAAHSVGDPTGHGLDHVPAFLTPDVADVLMVTGVVGGAVFLYLLALRIIPVISIWEAKEGLLYVTARPFKKLPLKVMAKPD
jgi:hypothetical protein